MVRSEHMQRSEDGSWFVDRGRSHVTGGWGAISKVGDDAEKTSDGGWVGQVRAPRDSFCAPGPQEAIPTGF